MFSKFSKSSTAGLRCCGLLTMLLLATGCAHQSKTGDTVSGAAAPVQPGYYEFRDEGLFGTAPSIIEEAEIFRLSEAQIAEFRDYISDPVIAHLPKYKRVFNYLEQSTHQFNYRGETYTAASALHHSEGNCLSLAILTTALARLADVRISYQLIDSSPVFERGENVIAKGVHVRSKLYQREKSEASDGLNFSFGSTGIIVDYFPHGNRRFLGNVTEQQFIARYYRNLAVDYLQQENQRFSYWYALKSMEYAPQDPEGINLMAVIHKRAGHLDKAEQFYQYGLTVAESKLSLLKNYRQLLVEQERVDEAAALSDKIANLDDPSPYNWLSLADAVFEQGNYREAARYYQRAVELAPYLQYGYLGLGRVYYKQGRYRQSKSMLLSARERNYNSEDDARYQAKIAALASVENH